VAVEKVRVITPFVGGGFGGKSPSGQAIEAARLAQATGRPVQVAWSRAEEFHLDTFDPAAVVRVAAGLDGDGKLAFWSYDVYGAGTRGADLLYEVPHVRMRSFGGRMSRSEERIGERLHPFGVGAWRAPGANMNVFARESQLDALAAAAAVDPLDLRLANASHPRLRRVLETAAETYGWRGRKSGDGRGHGVACGADAGSYVALMAEVEVDRASGAVRVERVVCAQEMGLVVNPEGARMQVEGCITMGLGYALAEELRFAGGRILDVNFDTYALPRFSWVPRIETVLVDAPGRKPEGGGEPAITPMGAVVANAVFAAAGVRMDRLPMTPERVLAALEAARETAA
jgi:isoquinoline 1-oxidoreductase